MRYVSIDVEATGLDLELDKVIQIGAVVDDTAWWKGDAFVDPSDLPQFKVNVMYDRIEGQIGALVLNARILASMKEYQDRVKNKLEVKSLDMKYGKFVDSKLVAQMFLDFVLEHSGMTNISGITRPSAYTGNSIIAIGQTTINVAGKIFGTFDRPMLKKLPGWDNRIVMRQNVLDPTMLYWNPFEDDQLPNLERCLDRSGHDPVVMHDALYDAMDVVRVLRSNYVNKKKLCACT